MTSENTTLLQRLFLKQIMYPDCRWDVTIIIHSKTWKKNCNDIFGILSDIVNCKVLNKLKTLLK